MHVLFTMKHDEKWSAFLWDEPTWALRSKVVDELLRWVYTGKMALPLEVPLEDMPNCQWYNCRVSLVLYLSIYVYLSCFIIIYLFVCLSICLLGPIQNGPGMVPGLVYYWAYITSKIVWTWRSTVCDLAVWKDWGDFFGMRCILWSLSS